MQKATFTFDFARVCSLTAFAVAGCLMASAQSPDQVNRTTSSRVMLGVDSTQAAWVSSPEELIRGRASGVRVTSADGAPGAAFDLLVRGIKFIKGSNQPLYVLDGVVLNPSQKDNRQGFWNDETDYQTVQSALGVIDPDDIKSIEILKDAAATALYGSLGANGVVLITTRQATARAPRISLNTSWAFAAPQTDSYRKRADMLGADQYLQYQGLDPASAGAPANWEKEMMRSTLSQNYYVSLQRMDKAGKAGYYMSGSFSDQKGVVQRTGTTGASVRLNIDYPLGSWGKVGARALLAFKKISMTQGAGPVEQSSALKQMSLAAPFALPGGGVLAPDRSMYYNSDFSSPSYLMENPALMLGDYDDNSNEWRAIPTFFAEANPFKWMTLRSRFGVDYRDKKRSRWLGAQGFEKGYDIGMINPATGLFDTENMTPYGSGGMASITYTYGLRYNWDNSVSVKFSGAFGTIGGSVGLSLNGTQFYESIAEGYNLPAAAFSLRADGEDMTSVLFPANYTSYRNDMRAGYATVSYNYGNRYFVDGSLRADNFITVQNGWDQYPSVGVAWVASNEKFMQGIGDIVSLLKVRGSWGRSGMKSSEPYRYFPFQGFGDVDNAFFYRTSDTTAVAGVLPTQRVAYTTFFSGDVTQSNVGIDLSLLRNRINISADYWWGTTSENLDVYFTNILRKSRSLGWRSHTKMKTQGVDLSVDARIIQNKDWTWSVGANAYWNAPEIVTATDNAVARDADGNVILTQSRFSGNSIGTTNGAPTPATVNQPGYAPMLFYGFRTGGILNNNTVLTAPSFRDNRAQAGTVRYYDANGDFNITDADKMDIGDPNPMFSFGLNSALTWKRLTLSTLFYGNYGNKIMNLNLLNMYNTSGSAVTNVRRNAFIDAWSQTNTSGAYPALGAAGTYEVSDRIVENGSFVRCDNITLGYRIPLGVKAARYVKALTVSASVRNVFVITDYSGSDPEVDSYAGDITRYGMDMGAYPRVRSCLIGVSATF